MKLLCAAAIVSIGLVSGATARDGNFTSTLSKGELQSAGLSNLTPVQREQLDALVERYTNRMAKGVAPSGSDSAPQAAQGGAQSGAPSPAPRPPPPPQRAETATGGSFLAAVKETFKRNPRPDASAVETTLPGKFRGFGPDTVFVLANGQRWQVANGDSYYSPAIENPKVEVTPATFGGYWLRFPDLDVQVRVKWLGGE